mmetsp:Transcript_16657/g.28593  ORF Transcript_16657/g.28593 Transcript_16657/m.28593 type:complete len:98 (+) Transcript_16657:422-715(+)
MLAVPPPAWYVQYIATNRFGAAMGTWFVGNMIQNALTSTGAFEVYANDQLVFSMLQEKRMITLEDIMAGMLRAGFKSNDRPIGGQQQGQPRRQGVLS